MQKETPQPKVNPTPVSDDHPFVQMLKRKKEIEAAIKAGKPFPPPQPAKRSRRADTV